jgi:ankyrin repeat protein
MSNNYKYINFVKETPTNDISGSLDGDSIRKFYIDVISEESNKKVDNIPPPILNVKKETESIKKLEKTNDEIKKLGREFLKAAQNNDIKTVEMYIKDGYDINVLDSFKWNALMKAVASKNINIVRLLLDNRVDVTHEDNSGNNAYKLAVRMNNEEIKNLIINTALSNDYDDNDVNIEETETEDKTLEYCQVCDTQYFKAKEKSHLTSIVHLLNENKSEKRSNLVNYTLKSSNKGYQMLVKSGWNEVSGLGTNEQGRIYPVKATKKDDRYGIGLDKKNRKKVSKSFNLFSRLNESKKDSKSVFKSIKDFKKTNKKLSKFEKDFREYFNS